MKMIIVLFLLISTAAGAEDFRAAEFGMSPQEVRATEEDADWESSAEDALAFETKLSGLDVVAGYIFVDERFFRGVYFMAEEHWNHNDYLREFEYFNGLLTKKYGQPKEKKTKWKSDDWKDDPGFALYQSDFSEHWEWETKTTLITHSIYGKDYKIFHRIDYESLEIPDLEEEKILDDL